MKVLSTTPECVFLYLVDIIMVVESMVQIEVYHFPELPDAV